MSVVDVRAWQKRFHAAGREKQVLLDELAPIRILYDDMSNRHRAELAPLKAQIRALMEKMAPLADEQAILARALKSKTGKP